MPSNSRKNALRRNPAGRSARQKGFTLIEVLVALAIIGVAMAAALRAMGVMIDNNRALHDKTLAMLAAENMLAQLRLEQTLPRAGTRSEPCAQGGEAMVCEIEFTNSLNRRFRQVTVRVHEQGRDGATLGMLSGLLSNLQ
ncbi:type II secretion system minor pseudopilin GspI [Bordetella sp. 2513F-2]